MCETDAKLFGKVAVVTGGSSGIGLEAAKDLAYRGARVIIASRNETRLRDPRNHIQNVTGNPYVTYGILDLGSLSSVRDFARQVVTEDRLDILVNNAGAVGLPDRLSEDNLNLTMQVNFFGTFLLTYLLLPLLKFSAPSRIINSSAVSMYIGHIDFNTWNYVGRNSPLISLANSKLALTLFTAELDQRLRGTGVTANSFDPFLVRDTNIFDNVDGWIPKNVGQYLVNLVGQRKTVVGNEIGYLAAAPELRDVSGVHYKFCRPWWNHWLVRDRNLTRILWDEAKRVVRISRDEDWEHQMLSPETLLYYYLSNM